MAPFQQMCVLVSICCVCLLLLATPASGITCVQCTPEELRCESGNMEPTECESSHRYCAMYRIFVGESQGVFRGCSQTWLRGCRTKMLDNQESTVCYHTCQWDGCNAGYGSMVSLL